MHPAHQHLRNTMNGAALNVHTSAAQYYTTILGNAAPYRLQQMQEERERHAVAEDYAATSKTAELLENAYNNQVAKTKEVHDARFKKNDRKSEEPPESPAQTRAASRKTQSSASAAPSSQQEGPSGS